MGGRKIGWVGRGRRRRSRETEQRQQRRRRRQPGARRVAGVHGTATASLRATTASASSLNKHMLLQTRVNTHTKRTRLVCGQRRATRLAVNTASRHMLPAKYFRTMQRLRCATLRASPLLRAKLRRNFRLRPRGNSARISYAASVRRTRPPHSSCPNSRYSVYLL